MSFSPLGNFVIDAPLNEGALAEAKSFLAKLPSCPVGSLDHCYLHWSVGHYNEDFSDYNACIRYDGKSFHIDLTHDPRDNAAGVNNNSPAPHTWLRNTRGFGIATDDMNGAGVNNFGNEPVTEMTLEYLCAAAGAVAAKYSIDLNGLTTNAPYQNEKPIMTHAVAAFTGGNPAPSEWYNYGLGGTVERWDLSSFLSVPEGVQLTQAMAIECSEALRQRARLYKVKLV